MATGMKRHHLAGPPSSGADSLRAGVRPHTLPTQRPVLRLRRGPAGPRASPAPRAAPLQRPAWEPALPQASEANAGARRDLSARPSRSPPGPAGGRCPPSRHLPRAPPCSLPPSSLFVHHGGVRVNPPHASSSGPDALKKLPCSFGHLLHLLRFRFRV